jgi:hypothetical protein
VVEFFRSSTQRIAALTVAAVLGAVGFLPLFSGPGYEQSLASGLIVPSAAAIATALELSSAADVAPLACVSRGLFSGAMLAMVAYATALAHVLRAGVCDFWGGTLFFILTAGFGALLGGVWGAAVAEVSRSVRRRLLRTALSVGLALAGPLGGIVVSVARFFSSPMIFAYDPFFGYFSGALYDTVVDVRTELWSYRAGSLATLLGTWLVASALSRMPDGGLAPSVSVGRRQRAARLAAGAVAWAASIGIAAEGPAFGHWQTGGSIADALGGRASGPRCDVIYPDSVPPGRAALLVQDCEEELAAVETRLGTALHGRVTAYEFSDAEQKRKLMGAAETSIAKPWRREVYVQLSGYPHPVLGHEIAHVVAGSFAPGPFHVGGGLIPNPGLIEGMAVAASPDDDELTDAQWARAMLDAGILPPTERLFSLRFLGQSAAKSYTAAGAFVGWFLARWGPERAHAWYGGQRIEGATGRSWSELDAEFRAWLSSLPMPADATTYARARFDKPSVWFRKCPHVVDAVTRAADRCRESGRYEQARALYGRALSQDPEDWRARFERGMTLMRFLDMAGGRAELEQIVSDDHAPRTWRDRAEEALADDHLVRGDTVEAAASYRDIAARTLDEDAARTLEVKALSAQRPLALRAIIDLLIGEPGQPLDPWLGALSAGLWSAGARQPLAAYVVGRNLATRGEWVRAASWLDLAVEWGGAPTPRIGRELLRQRAVCACALQDGAGLARVQAVMRGDGSPFTAAAGDGRRDWLERFVSRCQARLNSRPPALPRGREPGVEPHVGLPPAEPVKKAD